MTDHVIAELRRVMDRRRRQAHRRRVAQVAGLFLLGALSLYIIAEAVLYGVSRMVTP